MPGSPQHTPWSSARASAGGGFFSALRGDHMTTKTENQRGDSIREEPELADKQ